MSVTQSRLVGSLPVGLERRRGTLCFVGQSLTKLATRFGTPLYVYAEEPLEQQARAWCESMQSCFGERALVAYAVKANDRLRVLQTLARVGCGFDIVSEGEMLRALASGVDPERVVFSGVGKSDFELRSALQQGVRHINVESESELRRLSKVAEQQGTLASVSLRLTPDIAAGGHEKISTGRKTDKFGITPEHALELWRRTWQGIAFDGVAVHCGSQICDLALFEKIFRFVAEWAKKMQTLSLPVRRIDLGGGIGIDARGTASPSPLLYARAAEKWLAPFLADKTRILVEPGRAIAATAGLLLTRVIDVKRIADRTCLVVDAGMNDFLRCALYDAHHSLLPVVCPVVCKDKPASITNSGTKATKTWVVGPVCESSDAFGEHEGLAEVATGDVLALCLAGAYGAVMASDYNARARIAEVFIEQNGNIFLLRERENARVRLAEEQSCIEAARAREHTT